ncbi:MAG: hypothetical protein ACFCBW_15170 [Candidatus Competibacterales bacterium]
MNTIVLRRTSRRNIDLDQLRVTTSLDRLAADVHGIALDRRVVSEGEYQQLLDFLRQLDGRP